MVRTVFKREAEQRQQPIKALCPNSVNGHYKTEAVRALGVLQERPQCAEFQSFQTILTGNAHTWDFLTKISAGSRPCYSTNRQCWCPAFQCSVTEKAIKTQMGT